MIKEFGIVVDLDRCTGCFACEVACSQENNLPPGKQWIQVHTLGPVEDRGGLHTEYFPLMFDDCTICSHRILRGSNPFCVDSCPVKALTCGTADKILPLLGGKKRCQLIRLKKVDIPKDINIPSLCDRF